MSAPMKAGRYLRADDEARSLLLSWVCLYVVCLMIWARAMHAKWIAKKQSGFLTFDVNVSVLYVVQFNSSLHGTGPAR